MTNIAPTAAELSPLSACPAFEKVSDNALEDASIFA